MLIILKFIFKKAKEFFSISETSPFLHQLPNLTDVCSKQPRYFSLIENANKFQREKFKVWRFLRQKGSFITLNSSQISDTWLHKQKVCSLSASKAPKSSKHVSQYGSEITCTLKSLSRTGSLLCINKNSTSLVEQLKGPCQVPKMFDMS